MLLYCIRVNINITVKLSSSAAAAAAARFAPFDSFLYPGPPCVTSGSASITSI
jgi:hypothetical protein